MAEKDRIETGQEGMLDRTVSRRQFLKVAGVAGATIGMGAGLGGLLAACGGDDETTTTGAPTDTTGAPTDTTAAPGGETTTTVATGAEEGEEIKIGFVAPLTGGLASFGVPDQYCVDRWNEYAANGIVGGDNKNHQINIKIADSQSDSNRAAQVAGDLINNDSVDIVLVASTPDTVAPVADQCEALETPCLSDDCPWQPYVLSRSGGDITAEFNWTYHFFWGLEDIINNFQNMWDQVPNNKVVGALWPNDADGNAYREGFAPALEAAGYQVIDPGAYQNATEDFTAQISAFKEAGCEIITGVPIPPDATNFMTQASQQALKPKLITLAKALLFPQSVEALGPVGNGLTTEIWWTPRHPFTSSLTGETCAELAADFEAKTNSQWTQPLMHYATFEMAVACIKAAVDPKDKASIIEAAGKMKLDSIAGPIDFTAPIEAPAPGAMRPHKNVYKSPQVAGQWVMTPDGQYPFELVICTNEFVPEIAVEASVNAYEG